MLLERARHVPGASKAHAAPALLKSPLEDRVEGEVVRSRRFCTANAATAFASSIENASTSSFLPIIGITPSIRQA
jgi:hypothetical protein